MEHSSPNRNRPCDEREAPRCSNNVDAAAAGGDADETSRPTATARRLSIVSISSSVSYDDEATSAQLKAMESDEALSDAAATPAAAAPILASSQAPSLSTEMGNGHADDKVYDNDDRNQTQAPRQQQHNHQQERSEQGDGGGAAMVQFLAATASLYGGHSPTSTAGTGPAPAPGPHPPPQEPHETHEEGGQGAWRGTPSAALAVLASKVPSDESTGSLCDAPLVFICETSISTSSSSEAMLSVQSSQGDCEARHGASRGSHRTRPNIVHVPSSTLPSMDRQDAVDEDSAFIRHRSDDLEAEQLALVETALGGGGDRLIQCCDPQEVRRRSRDHLARLRLNFQQQQQQQLQRIGGGGGAQEKAEAPPSASYNNSNDNNSSCTQDCGEPLHAENALMHELVVCGGTTPASAPAAASVPSGIADCDGSPVAAKAMHPPVLHGTTIVAGHSTTNAPASPSHSETAFTMEGVRSKNTRDPIAVEKDGSSHHGGGGDEDVAQTPHDDTEPIRTSFATCPTLLPSPPQLPPNKQGCGPLPPPTLTTVAAPPPNTNELQPFSPLKPAHQQSPRTLPAVGAIDGGQTHSQLAAFPPLLFTCVPRLQQLAQPNPPSQQNPPALMVTSTGSTAGTATPRTTTSSSARTPLGFNRLHCGSSFGGSCVSSLGDDDRNGGIAPPTSASPCHNSVGMASLEGEPSLVVVPPSVPFALGGRLMGSGSGTSNLLLSPQRPRTVSHQLPPESGGPQLPIFRRLYSSDFGESTSAPSFPPASSSHIGVSPPSGGGGSSAAMVPTPPPVDPPPFLRAAFDSNNNSQRVWGGSGNNTSSCTSSRGGAAAASGDVNQYTGVDVSLAMIKFFRVDDEDESYGSAVESSLTPCTVVGGSGSSRIALHHHHHHHHHQQQQQQQPQTGSGGGGLMGAPIATPINSTQSHGVDQGSRVPPPSSTASTTTTPFLGSKAIPLEPSFGALHSLLPCAAVRRRSSATTASSSANNDDDGNNGGGGNGGAVAASHAPTTSSTVASIDEDGCVEGSDGRRCAHSSSALRSTDVCSRELFHLAEAASPVRAAATTSMSTTSDDNKNFGVVPSTVTSSSSSLSPTSNDNQISMELYADWCRHQHQLQQRSDCD